MADQERHQEAADQPVDDLSSKPENSLTDKMTKENQEEVPDSAEGNDLLSKLGQRVSCRAQQDRLHGSHHADGVVRRGFAGKPASFCAVSSCAGVMSETRPVIRSSVGRRQTMQLFATKIRSPSRHAWRWFMPLLS